MKRFIIAFLLILGSAFQSFAGDPDLFYYVSDGTNELYSINRTSGVATLIGATGVSNIEAIAFYPIPGANQLFATNAGDFGSLNTTTGAFTLIGEVDGGGTANGSAGPQSLNDVDGLMLDGQTFKMWAIERNGGATPDLLFQIDITTGLYVSDAFGVGIDYVEITGPGIDVDADDLAVNPTNGRIYASSNDNGNNDVLIEINKYTGVFSFVANLSEDDVEGLAFSNDGQLYGSEGDGDNRLGQINITTGVVSNFFSFTGSDVEGLASLVADANSASGTVFEDLNFNGVEDGGEPGIANVRVYLYQDNNNDGKVDPEDTRVQSTLTDVNGDYTFYYASTGNLLTSTQYSSYPAAYALTTDNVESMSFTDAVNFAETDANNNFGLATGPDCDGDGLPNFLEGGGDSDLDMVADSCDLDSDNDGILDSVEGTEDFDDDGIPDYIDRDTDDDGIPDAIEANAGIAPAGYVASSGNISGTDSDGNGIVDSRETAPGSGIMVSSNPDSDGDGRLDVRDLDSDNDGILDIIEAGGIDADFDGQVDDGADANSNGYRDIFETNPLPIPNTDGTSYETANGLTLQPNYIDIDSDADGLDDTREGYSTPSYAYPSLTIDSDEDGIIDFWDVSTFGTPITPFDKDRDNTADYIDLDTDNDGVSDFIEGNDVNADGVADFSNAGTDTNGNGLDDNFEGNSCGGVTASRTATQYGEERDDNGNVTTTGSSDLELTYEQDNSRSQTVAVRFPNVILSQGARVSSSYIQFQVDEATSGTVSILIEGELATNSAAIATGTNTITSRSRTVQKLTWSPANWVSVGNEGAAQRTVDVSSILEEIIAQGAWSSGNAITFIFSGTGTNTRIAEVDPILFYTEATDFCGSIAPHQDFDGDGEDDWRDTDDDADGIPTLSEIPDADGSGQPDYLESNIGSCGAGSLSNPNGSNPTSPIYVIIGSGDAENPDRAEGAPNDNFSKVDNGETLDLDFRTTISAGDTLILYWQIENAGSETIFIDESLDGISYSANPTTPSLTTTSTTVITDTFVAGIDLQYIRITKPAGSVKAEVDALVALQSATSFTASNGTGTANNPERAEDKPDDNLAEIDDGEILNLEFATTVRSGSDYNIYWQLRNAGTSETIFIAESMDGVTYTANTSVSTASGTIIQSTITAAMDFKFIRITKPGTVERAEIDAVVVDQEGEALLNAQTGSGTAANPDRAEGRPDDSFAEIDDGEILILDFNTTLLSGDTLTLYWRLRNSGASETIFIDESIDGINYFANPTTPSLSTSSATVIQSSFTAGIDLRYIRIRKPGTVERAQVDAIFAVKTGTECLTDSDNDSIADVDDIDDDNDGILDINEGLGSNNPAGDEDGDGILNFKDVVDNGNGGDGSTTDYTDSNGDGIPDVFDFDSDGIPDHLDLDSDNDGIPDIIEAGGVDTDANGRVDDYDDTDQDGWSNVFDSDDGGVALTDGDKDGDGLENRLDLDADDDGIADIVEAGGEDTDGDGRVDDNTDTDNDGFADTFDNDNLGTPLPIKDNDGDGIQNFLDLDSDNDGIIDNVEGQTTAAFLAPLGTDTDGDGWDDRYDSDDGGTAITLSNKESFGEPDYLDDDSDGDGVVDWIEGFDDNEDGDALVDFLNRADAYETAASNPGDYVSGTDTDGDDLPDFLEDDDGDNVPNFLDPDSGFYHDDDNDGLINLYDSDNFGTANTTPTSLSNFDADAEPDFRDSDTEITLTETDHDNDGIIDSIDLDDDNDGLLDTDEGTGLNNPVGDEDGDGILNFEDNTDNGNGGDGSTTDYTDTNGDGIPDVFDTDGDGVPNHFDLDSDNDGIADIVESGGEDTDGNGLVDDINTDGTLTTDTDNDGLADLYDDDNGGTAIANPDTDGDGINDNQDLDSDNDGIPDVVEAGGTDENGDGRADDFADSDSDGFNDVVDGDVGQDGTSENSANALTLTGADTDNDGVPNSYPSDDNDGDGILNALDLDADNDGIPDVVEAGGTDENGDGRADDYVDADGDGFNDVVDGDPTNALAVGSDLPGANTGDALTATGSDTDNDGAPDTRPNGDFDQDGLYNYLDLDADGDGILDILEAEGTDTDSDGIEDSFTDSDNDGYNDNVDGDPTNALALGDDSNGSNSANSTLSTGPDSDGDGRPNSYPDGDFDGDTKLDYLDIDSDNDGIVDNTEAQSTAGYLSPLNTDADGDGIDTRYDANDGLFGGAGSGLTPVDTDFAEEPDSPDYKDVDSENDGISDLIEGHDTDGDELADAGSPANTGVPGGMVDLDNDGLLDGFDNNTASSDATNGGLQGTSHPNVTNPITSERDWREVSDKDNDGISDAQDIDDDNDGILDENECAATPKQTDVFTYTGADQTYNVPAGATEIRGKVWGAGGRGDERSGRGVGGAGGYTEFTIPVSSLTSTTLIVTVGQGGNSSTNGDRTYGNGGAGSDGTTNSFRNFGAGGGMSAVSYSAINEPDTAIDPSLAISEIIVIAGGGGTMPAFSNAGTKAGDGGGTSGSDATDGNVGINGLGGNQVAGGGSTNGDPGGYLYGGNSGPDKGAGGGGYYGGGSGSFLSNDEGGGGGGSGYISNATRYGQTLRSTVTQVPPRNTDPSYVAGVGVGGNSNSGIGGNGLVVLEAIFLDCDEDGDGIVNSLDLDSDNDGIPDMVEAGGVDADNDGRVDGFVDSDGDGWANTFDSDDGGTPLTDGDQDGDGFKNRLDLDSDDDGLADIIEAGGADTDNDGRADVTTDGDDDGWANLFDGDDGGTVLPVPDTDGDGTLPNYLDLDSDNDGIIDNIEWQTTADFMVPSGTDANNNGWDDEYDDGPTPQAISNNDGAGDGADYIDLNSDTDSEPDWLERADDDEDGDALLDLIAIADAYELANGNPNHYVSSDDADADGIPDFLESAGVLPAFLTPGNAFYRDTDNDGLVDFYDSDQNGDNRDNVNQLGDVDNSGDYDFRDATNDVTLPIELIKFTATKVGNYVQLDWSTATEINNDYFTIEKSTDGENFEYLLTEDGAGNSSVKLDYRRYDEQPEIGYNYYKLTQTDFNGESEEFNIEVVKFDGVNSTADGLKTTMYVYPNPTEGAQLNLRINQLDAGRLRLELMTTEGQLIRQQVQKIESETRDYEVEVLQGKFLAAGTYYLRVITTEKVEVLPFIVK